MEEKTPYAAFCEDLTKLFGSKVRLVTQHVVIEALKGIAGHNSNNIITDINGDIELIENGLKESSPELSSKALELCNKLVLVGGGWSAGGITVSDLQKGLNVAITTYISRLEALLVVRQMQLGQKEKDLSSFGGVLKKKEETFDKEKEATVGLKESIARLEALAQSSKETFEANQKEITSLKLLLEQEKAKNSSLDQKNADLLRKVGEIDAVENLNKRALLSVELLSQNLRVFTESFIPIAHRGKVKFEDLAEHEVRSFAGQLKKVLVSAGIDPENPFLLTDSGIPIAVPVYQAPRLSVAKSKEVGFWQNPEDSPRDDGEAPTNNSKKRGPDDKGDDKDSRALVVKKATGRRK